MLAFGMPSTGEWMLILMVGVIVYGRRLPEVGRQLGRTVANLRRGLDDFKREVDRDGSLREARNSLHDLKRAIDAPRRLADPHRLLNDLTDSAQKDDVAADQAHESAAADDGHPFLHGGMPHGAGAAPGLEPEPFAKPDEPAGEASRGAPH